MNEHYLFELVPLPYPYDALEPYIDKETVTIHHTKHQANYVKGLNEALKNCPDLQHCSLEALLCNHAQLPENMQVAIHRNAGGVYAHELYFDCMTGTPLSACPVGQLAEKIDVCFSSFEAFKDVFTQTALAQFGSGWAWLAEKPDGILTVLATSNQDTPLPLGMRPILLVDVWEHAYYLKYQNRRADYLTAWWNLVDWQFAEENYAGGCGGSGGSGGCGKNNYGF